VTDAEKGREIYEGMFREVLEEVLANDELMHEWFRLHPNSAIDPRRVPVVKMVDKATGAEADAAREFLDFVHDYIFMPIFRLEMSAARK